MRWLLLTLGAALALGATAAFAASLTVTSQKLAEFTSCALDSSSGGIDDTFSKQDTATSTSNVTTLDVKADSGAKNRYSFIKFTNLLSSCVGLSGASVKSATLTLQLTTAPTHNKTYTVSRVDTSASWTQTTLTWNNQPGVVAATTTFASGTTTGTRTADVTSDVALYASGTTNQGWRIADLVTTTNDTGQFASAENTTAANRPKLTIGYVN